MKHSVDIICKVKIYTKTGDVGTTSLFGGKRIEKNSTRIEAYGNVDELNSQIGTIIAENPPSDILKKLLRIQKELFVLGSDLATPLEFESKNKSQKVKVPRVTKAYVTRLEKEIDSWSEKLPKLRNFIFPGGRKIGSKLHLARSITRRTERSIVALSQTEKINKNAQIYINRLSDWFFVLARYINKLEGVKENLW